MFRSRKSGDGERSQQSRECKEDRCKDDPPMSDRLEEGGHGDSLAERTIWAGRRQLQELSLRI